MADAIASKRCVVCGEEKALNAFRGANKATDGKAAACKACNALRTPVAKPCVVCGLTKQPSEFNYDAGRDDRRTARCSSCIAKMGSANGTKWCRGCGQWKKIDQFNSNGSGVLRPHCRVCRAAQRGSGRRIASDALIDSGFKRCPGCKAVKPIGEFGLRSERRRNPYVGECRDCWRLRNKAGVPSRHGLTIEQWQKILADQGGVCAICETDEPGGRGQWHIDHDHACCSGDKSCGKCVRGLLCSRCNAGLGMFRDNTSSLFRAISYLEAYASRGNGEEVVS